MTRRWLIRIAAGALAVAILSSCSGNGKRTILVGDSLMVQGSPAAKALLKGDGSVKVVAFPGVRIDQFQDEVERAVAKDPDALVILLGANNVGQGGWTSGDAGQLELMVGALAKARCVRWINASTTTTRADYNQGATAFNAELARQVAPHPRMKVVDWAGRFAANPGWVIPGDIHLTVAGREAMGRTIAAAAKDCLDR